MPAINHFDVVQKIYIAYYQRPADPAGLKYWAERVDAAGGDAATMIDAFAASAEARTLYGEMTKEVIGEVIEKIYQALFGRAPEDAGKAYYEAAFAAGTITAGNIALAILEAAQASDKAAIANKVAVANTFTELVGGHKLNDPAFATSKEFAFDYAGDEAAAAARKLLAGVTHNDATVPATVSVGKVLQGDGQSGGGGSSAPGFTLTVNLDEKFSEFTEMPGEDDQSQAQIINDTIAFSGRGAVSFATVTLLHAQDGDELLFTDTPDIEGDVTDGPDGNMVLTLTAVADRAPTRADFEAALKSVRFNNTSDNPDTAPRTVQFQVSDGAHVSNAATQSVKVLAANDAPVTAAATVTTDEDVPYTLKAADFTFSDADNSDTLKEIRILSAPENGTLKLGDIPLSFTDGAAIVPASSIEMLSFTPAADANGAGYATIHFEVVDQAGASSQPQSIAINVEPVNDAPTDITLSANKVVKNATPGTTIGTLATVDPDSGDTFTYSLADGDGVNDADNDLVEIVDGQLRTKSEASEFENQSSLEIYVKAVDAKGESTFKALTVKVTDVNKPPTDIILSANSIAENAPAGTVIATLSALDPNADDTFTYSLQTSGTGNDADNGLVVIEGNELKVKSGATIDFESNPSLDVYVWAVDAGGATFSKGLTVNVDDVNESPTAVGFTPILTSIAESTDMSAAIEVGTIKITDDLLGTNVPTLTGADAASFELLGDTLYLKAGTTLDAATKDSYEVTVSVRDLQLTDTTPVTADLTLTVSDSAENRIIEPAGDALDLVFLGSDEGAESARLANDLYSHVEVIRDFDISDDTLPLGNAALANKMPAQGEVLEDEYVIVFGTYRESDETFIAGNPSHGPGNDPDAIVLWDGNSDPGTQLEAVVLMGVGDGTFARLDGLDLTFFEGIPA